LTYEISVNPRSLSTLYEPIESIFFDVVTLMWDQRRWFTLVIYSKVNIDTILINILEFLGCICQLVKIRYHFD